MTGRAFYGSARERRCVNAGHLTGKKERKGDPAREEYKKGKEISLREPRSGKDGTLSRKD